MLQAQGETSAGRLGSVTHCCIVLQRGSAQTQQSQQELSAQAPGAIVFPSTIYPPW